MEGLTVAEVRIGTRAGGGGMSASDTTRVTLALPTDIYQEIAAAKERQETSSVAGFIREAVEEKVNRMRWQRNLAELRAEIQEAGGLKLRGGKEELMSVLERLGIRFSRPSTLICIDSNQFIFGLTERDRDSSKLLDLLSEFNVVVPRLVVQEVARNLDTAAQVRMFYRLLYSASNVAVIDEPVPRELVDKYEQLGLPEKADAVIGAFVEWVGASCLISDNRHFVQELHSDAFQVLSPAEFLAGLDTP